MQGNAVHGPAAHDGEARWCMGDDRPRIQLRLTEEARAGLYAFAGRHRVSLTALLEALGRIHDTATIDPAVIAEAKRIDTERNTWR